MSYRGQRSGVPTTAQGRAIRRYIREVQPDRSPPPSRMMNGHLEVHEVEEVIQPANRPAEVQEERGASDQAVPTEDETEAVPEAVVEEVVVPDTGHRTPRRSRSPSLNTPTPSDIGSPPPLEPSPVPSPEPGERAETPAIDLRTGSEEDEVQFLQQPLTINESLDQIEAKFRHAENVLLTRQQCEVKERVSRLFRPEGDQRMIRELFREHVRDGLSVSLTLQSPVILWWGDVSKDINKKLNSRWQATETATYQFSGRQQNTMQYLVAREQSPVRNRALGVMDFSTPQPSGFSMIPLRRLQNPTFLRRRFFENLEDSEIQWLEERSMRLVSMYLHDDDPAPTRVLYLNYTSAVKNERKLIKFLRLSRRDVSHCNYLWMLERINRRRQRREVQAEEDSEDSDTWASSCYDTSSDEEEETGK